VRRGERESFPPSSPLSPPLTFSLVMERGRKEVEGDFSVWKRKIENARLSLLLSLLFLFLPS